MTLVFWVTQGPFLRTFVQLFYIWLQLKGVFFGGYMPENFSIKVEMFCIHYSSGYYGIDALINKR